MSHDPQDEAVLLAVLGLRPAATAAPRGLGPVLATYVRLVAEKVGVPAEAVTHEVTDTATAYLGLTARTVERPQRDLMLVWDERLGWYVGIEPQGNDEPPVICYLGGDIVPTPERCGALRRRRRQRGSQRSAQPGATAIRPGHARGGHGRGGRVAPS